MKTETPLLLIGESFAPWTMKARWALEYCGLSYEYQEFTPTLSEPSLRCKLRQWSGSISVPMLFAGRRVIRDSWEIARYASELAGDVRLGDMEAISAWNALSEAALAEGRGRLFQCLLANKPALEESLPAFVPQLLRGPMSFMARDTVKRLDRQYGHLVTPGALYDGLVAMRESLAHSGDDYLLGDFSYADITMAVVLEMIVPIARTEPPLGPATRSCWSDAALADEFKDLLDWRDRLVADVATSYSQFGSSQEA